MKYIANKGEDVVLFNSQSGFCERFKVKQGAVSKCLKGSLRTTGGWRFSLCGDNYSVFEELEILDTSTIDISLYFDNKNYWNIAEYAEKIGVCRKTIENRIKKGLLLWDRSGNSNIRIYGDKTSDIKFRAISFKRDKTIDFTNKSNFSRDCNISIDEINQSLTGELETVGEWKILRTN